MWNNGKDKYIILNNKVYKSGDELKVFFKDFRYEYIDLYNCASSDFLFLLKEKKDEILVESIERSCEPGRGTSLADLRLKDELYRKDLENESNED